MQEIPSSFGVNTTVTAGVYDGECQATPTNGVSQVIPHMCSDAGKSLTFCVVFEYMLCRKTSVSNRQCKQDLIIDVKKWGTFNSLLRVSVAHRA